MNTCGLKMLRKPEALKKTGLGATSFYYQIKKGVMPPPIKLGEKAAAYLEHELDAVIACRAGGGTESDLREVVEYLVNHREYLFDQVLTQNNMSPRVER